MNIELMKTIANNIKSEIGCALIAKVVKVNNTTVDCRPVTLKNVVINEEIHAIPFPVFPNVPVSWQQGGGSYTAYPVAVGDYCILLTFDSCIDNWWEGKDNQRCAENRLHDYSDCVALFGLCNREGAFAIPKIATTVGNHVFTHNLTVKLNVSIEANLDVKCKITADEIEARKSLKVDNIDVGNHTHGGVETGNGSTGTPQ
ncbi:MAG: Gp138 family membrane-puncturing spike protein [Candidatus Phlomobacter fragariae]